ncbi:MULTISPECIES: hypothetical protein [unclassified Rhodococcus (in: high G+C Gram-positive bacteria)]|nr:MULTISPECIES: hypothetical protein [unclassified Rhodococcus (in: high G+C Gram-positive bacteria)]
MSRSVSSPEWRRVAERLLARVAADFEVPAAVRTHFGHVLLRN